MKRQEYAILVMGVITRSEAPQEYMVGLGQARGSCCCQLEPRKAKSAKLGHQ